MARTPKTEQLEMSLDRAERSSGSGAKRRKGVSTGSKSRVRRSRSDGSGFDRKPGRRPMKEYPLTKGELFDLAFRGGFATMFFSFAGLLLGLSFDVAKDVSMNPELPETAKVFWQTTRNFLFSGALISFLLGVVFIVWGGSRLKQIIDETKHDER